MLDRIKIVDSADVGDDINIQMSSLFVEAFDSLLKPFGQRRETLIEAFTPLFNPACFSVALDDKKVVSMAALSKGGEKPLSPDRKHLVKVLGMLKGNILYFVLKKELNTSTYPVRQTPGTGIIQYVATKQTHRGRRLASALIRHLIETSDCDTFILEVADNNKTAIAVYEGLGFKTIATKPVKHTKHTGISQFLYMKLQRDTYESSD